MNDSKLIEPTLMQHACELCGHIFFCGGECETEPHPMKDGDCGRAEWNVWRKKHGLEPIPEFREGHEYD
jgi:hypothetical protein